MDKFITTATGGHGIVLDDLRWITGQVVGGNQAIIQALEDLLRGEALSDDFIVSGLVLSGSNPTKSLTAGWVLLGGDLLQVAARSADIDDTTDNRIILSTSFDATGDKTLLNGSTAQTYEKNRGIVSGTSGNLDIRTPKRIMDLLDDTYSSQSFSAGNFGGSGGGSWVVEEGDVTTNRFRVLGKTLFWEIVIADSTIGTAPTSLDLTIPGGFNAKNAWRGLGAQYNDGSNSFTNLNVGSAAGASNVNVSRENSAAYTAGTNNQDISFNITIEIE